MSVNTAAPTIQDIEQLLCATEHDFVERDRATCDCPITFVRRKWHAALGRGSEIRLCCMAKKVEELAGLSPGTLFLTLDFEPSWEWDCDREQISRVVEADGTITETIKKLGPPPRWLRERMDRKGITIRNLPNDGKE